LRSCNPERVLCNAGKGQCQDWSRNDRCSLVAHTPRLNCIYALTCVAILQLDAHHQRSTMDDKDLKTALSRRMRAARQSRWPDQSQAEFARLIRVRPSQILRWERGDTLPRLPQLVRYAQACGTTAEQLFANIGRRALPEQMPLPMPLDPPARAVVIRLIDLLQERRAPAPRRRARR
jgi:transcriptional regulator with XRE-family HTH domain